MGWTPRNRRSVPGNSSRLFSKTPIPIAAAHPASSSLDAVAPFRASSWPLTPISWRRWEWVEMHLHSPTRLLGARRDNFTFTYTATIFEVLQFNRAGNNASDVQTKGEAVRPQPWLLPGPPPTPFRQTYFLPWIQEEQQALRKRWYIYIPN
jgi:hypothetical protein